MEIQPRVLYYSHEPITSTVYVAFETERVIQSTRHFRTDHELNVDLDGDGVPTGMEFLCDPCDITAGMAQDFRAAYPEHAEVAMAAIFTHAEVKP